MITSNSGASAGVISKPSLLANFISQRCLALFLITAAGTVLRLWSLGKKSFWTDEGASFVIAHQNWTGFWHTIFRHEANASLYYLLLHFWLHLGNSEFVIRLLSVLAGVATLPIVYLLGEKIYDRRVGVLAVALLAVHPAHVAYSQEARGYSFVVLFAVLSVYFFIQAMERTTTDWWFWYSITTVLAVYCHSFAILLIAAQLASLVFMPAREIPWRGLFISLAAMVVFTGPLLLLIGSQNQGQWAWLSKFAFREFSHLMTFLTGNGVRLFLYLMFWIAALAAWTRALRNRRSVETWREGLLIVWLVVPVLMVTIASLVRPVLASRFLLFCVPAVLLAAARGFFAIPYRKPAAAVLVLLIALSVASLRSYYCTPKEDWRGAAKVVLSAARPGEPIVLWDSPAFAYYRARLGGGANLGFLSPEDWVTASGHSSSRVWMVLYEHDSWSDPGKTIVTEMRNKYGDEQKRVFGRDIWVLRYDVKQKQVPSSLPSASQ